MSERARPRILVLGRTGQLATDLAAAAPALGVDLTVAGRPECDIAEASSIERTIAAARPDAVVNAAAYTNVDKAESEPELANAVNRDGPGYLARACRAAGLPLIHVSTDMVFGDDRDRPHREGDAPNPLSRYARSKLEGEGRVAAELDRHLIVRVSWVFGPSGDNFVSKLLSWARARPELSIVADQRGRPTWSPDLARTLFGLAQRQLAGPGAPPGVLHVAGASVMTRDAQARLVMAGSAARGGPSAVIRPVATCDFPTPAKRPLNAVLDIGLAERHGIRLGEFAADLETTLDTLLGPRCVGELR